MLHGRHNIGGTFTLETLRAGDRVRSGKQPERGIGKVVYADAVTAAVYFKDRTKTVPETRISEFRLGAPLKAERTMTR